MEFFLAILFSILVNCHHRITKIRVRGMSENTAQSHNALQVFCCGSDPRLQPIAIDKYFLAADSKNSNSLHSLLQFTGLHLTLFRNHTSTYNSGGSSEFRRKNSEVQKDIAQKEGDL